MKALQSSMKQYNQELKVLKKSGAEPRVKAAPTKAK